ncbi:MAG: DUF1634 domain-containing protein [Planctomycetes bacterium]|nr:DUF1634 domain-containing protein [Planctomycetota bacterium]
MSSPTPDQATNTHRIELLIGNLLRLGVIVSLTLVTLGTLVTFIGDRDRPDAASLDVLHLTQTRFPHTLTSVLREAAAFHGPGLVMLGILVLVATPVARVVAAVALFTAERDRIYIALTTVVLIMLVVSFFLGRVE